MSDPDTSSEKEDAIAVMTFSVAADSFGPALMIATLHRARALATDVARLSTNTAKREVGPPPRAPRPRRGDPAPPARDRARRGCERLHPIAGFRSCRLSPLPGSRHAACRSI